MQLFLSWSGTRSKATAEAISDWIPKVIQAVEPWMSSDIEKGARWSPAVSTRLESSRVGIICLTRDNLGAPWLLFEAGALSKTVEAHVCTFLLDVTPTDVQQPLGQFQHTSLDKQDFLQLVRSINSAVARNKERSLADAVLDDVFDTYWPRLASALTTIAKQPEKQVAAQRTDREVLLELLELVRAQERRFASLEETQVKARSEPRTRVNLQLDPEDLALIQSIRGLSAKFKRIETDGVPPDPSAA